MCVVVGGGEVAQRKTESLIVCHARVKVVAPSATADIIELADKGIIEYASKYYEPSDLDGALLAIAATNDMELNRRISADCRERGVLVNVVDVPALCDFFVPSIIRRGDLVISISTSGRGPAMAKYIKEVLGKEIGDEYGLLLKMVSALRDRLMAAEGTGSKKKNRILADVLRSDILDAIRARDRDKIEKILREHAGEELRLSDLGIEI